MKVFPALVGLFLVLVSSSGISRPGWADEGPPEIRFVNGHFEPSELVIQAGTAFSLRVTNVSDAPIEFESFELHRERVVAPGETITVHFPALLAGSFKFFDDFHSEVPEGAIVAK